MLNHSRQINLFNMRAKEFHDTKKEMATHQMNAFIIKHNQNQHAKFLVEPVDDKFSVDNGKTYILMTYIPHKNDQANRKHYIL